MAVAIGNGVLRMNYLAQAKTLLQHGKDTQKTDEKEAHLTVAVEMLEKAIAAQESPSELSWQERDVLEIFRNKRARPDQDIGSQPILQAWGARGSVDEFWAAIGRLEQRGWVNRNADQVSFQLTAGGYRRIGG
jgi:hypothetical protein